MKIETMKVDDLIPYERNPRDNDKAVDAVANSIKEFGFLVPVVIDKDNVVAAGHTRIKAAKKLGIKEVPAVRASDLTDEQIRAFRLADNKTSELAGWDFDILPEEIKEIQDLDLTKFGFEQNEIEDPEDVKEDDYDEDAETIPKRVRAGDVWTLGKHRLKCGDSTSSDDLESLLDGERPEMVFTDPPYGVAIGDKNKFLDEFDRGGPCQTNIEGDAIPEDELREMLIKAFTNLREHAADSCSYYVTSPQAGDLHLMMMEMMKESGLEVRHNLIWVKNRMTFSLGRLDYSYKHEPVFYTWTKRHNFYGGYESTVIDDTTPIDKMTKAELKDLVRAYKSERPESVIYCDKPMRAELHPTMKPVKLIARFIINSSKKDDPVCDIFGGSGSTMIACEQLGRRCYMMEIDPHYCDVIIDRWEKFTGEKAARV